VAQASVTDSGARRLLFSLQRRTGVANVVGMAVVSGYLLLVSGPGGLSDRAEWVTLVVGVIYLVLVSAVGEVLERRSFRPVREWLDAGRPPTEREQHTLLAQPWLQAGLNLGYWVVAAILLGAVTALENGSSVLVARVVTAFIQAGMVTYGLSFLLVERRLRSVFARALGGTPPEQAPSLGIRRRMLLSWLLGSGVALVAIIVEPIGHVSGVSPSVFIAGVGLATGAVLTYIAAGALAEPLRHLEQAMTRVAAGDLDAVVHVDDGGEVGMLQAGFNSMVEGLRERERISELFGRHVGEEVREQALALDPNVGLFGELREVSALFVDVTGSTRLARTKSPTEVVADLNALFEAVVRTAREEGGWVNKFEGDAALCVWGAPEDVDDHAARALRTAIALRRELVKLAVTHRDLDAGIGVSSGTAVVGNIGAEERYEYTVIGDPVNEASRLTELAKAEPGRVLASGAAVSMADGGAGDWCPMGAVMVRGRDEPTELFAPG
jgi:adenylate cyclase